MFPAKNLNVNFKFYSHESPLKTDSVVFEPFFIKVSNPNAGELQSRGRRLAAIFLCCFRASVVPGLEKPVCVKMCVCVCVRCWWRNVNNTVNERLSLSVDERKVCTGWKEQKKTCSFTHTHIHANTHNQDVSHKHGPPAATGTISAKVK